MIKNLNFVQKTDDFQTKHPKSKKMNIPNVYYVRNWIYGIQETEQTEDYLMFKFKDTE